MAHIMTLNSTDAHHRKTNPLELRSFGVTFFLLLLGAGLFIAAQSVTLFLAERRFLEKYRFLDMGQWTGFDWATAGLSCLSGLFLALALLPHRKIFNEALIHGVPEGRHLPKFLLAAGMFTFVSTAVMMIWFPAFFAEHVNEVRLISLSQEFMILCGLACLITTTVKISTSDAPSVLGVPATALLALLSTAILLLLLEEISYGQHFFGWQTGAAFENNIQDETNFHNFYTYRFELAYYWAAALCFLVLPVLKLSRLPQLLPAPIANAFYYVPPIGFALAALPICTLLYESWSIVPFQILFFLGLFTTIGFYLKADIAYKPWLGGLLVTCLISCAAINLYGFQLPEMYEPSEMRELAIAYYIAAYGFWLLGTCRAAK